MPAARYSFGATVLPVWPICAGVGVPAGVDHRARGGDGAAERRGELLAELEALGLAEAAAAGDEDVGVLDVDVGAALLAALDHRRLGRAVRAARTSTSSTVAAPPPVSSISNALRRPMMMPTVAVVLDLGDRRVAEDRALGDELAALDVDRGDLHRHAGVQARGQAGADLEAEQAAAEQRVVVAAVGDDLGHRVDDRLREALGALGAEDLRRAVVAERGREVVGDALADDDRVRLAAELGGELGALGDGAERVLVERALVVERVDQDVAIFAPS